MLNEDEKAALAMEAMDLLEEAERLESQREWAKAIYRYQTAADKLAKSGVVDRSKVEQIYDKITELNRTAAEEKSQGTVAPTESPEALQERAFQFLDEARDAERRGDYAGAIERFLEAAGLMMQAGWSEAQVESIQEEVRRVQVKLASSSAPTASEQSRQPAEELPTFARLDSTGAGGAAPALRPPIATQPPSVGEKEYVPTFARLDFTEPGEVPSTPPHLEATPPAPPHEELTTVTTKAPEETSYLAVLEFDRRRRAEQEAQEAAFKLLDEAGALADRGDLSGAVNRYTEAINRLQEIGWTSETAQIVDVVESLQARLHAASASGEVTTGKTPTLPAEQGGAAAGAPAEASGGVATELFDPYAARTAVAQRLAARKEKEAEVQGQAFELLDEANELARRRDYEGARLKYHQAIDLLNSIGWYAQTRLIYETLEQLDEKERGEAKASEALPAGAAGKAGATAAGTTGVTTGEGTLAAGPVADENELLRQRLQAEFQRRRETVAEFEARKAEEERIQNEAFGLIDQGYELVANERVDDALEAFNKAISLLNAIGWQAQTKQLGELVTRLVEDERKKVARAQAARLQSARTRKEQLEFQKLLEQKAKEKASEIAAREASAAERAAEKARLEQIQAEAFSLVEQAERLRSALPPRFDDALELYQKAHRLLQAAGWQVQADRLFEIISDVQKEKERVFQEQQRTLEKARREREEQKRLRAQLREQVEREEREREEQRRQLAEFEARREQLQNLETVAMGHVNQASTLVRRRMYLEAIKHYQQAAQLFQQAGWERQVPYILAEIENCKELQVQKDREEAEAARLRIREQLAKKKAEEELRRAEEARKGLVGDLKGMIAKAAEAAEAKKLREKLESKQAEETYLQREREVREKRAKMSALREEIRRKIEEEARLKREREEEERKRKAKETRDEIRAMLEAAKKKEGGK